MYSICIPVFKGMPRVSTTTNKGQQNPRPSQSTPISDKNPAPTQALVEVSSSQTERPRSPENERNHEYQSTINRLLSVIENKFLDIVILVDGSDSFNQINRDDRFKTTYHRMIRNRCIRTVYLTLPLQCLSQKSRDP